MAENTIKVRQKQRYDTEANWKSKDPILLAGEMAISSDKNGRFKVGDGKNKWSVLTYSKADLSKSDVTTALGYTPPTTNTTYSIGTASTAGIGKLYTATGTATDGSMTQAAITSALNGKSSTGHTHTKSQITDLPAFGNVVTKNVKTATSKKTLEWTSADDAAKYVPDMNMLAYWNGAYNNTNSNLTYCNRGAFGTIVTKNVGDYLPISGGTITGTIKKNTQGGLWKDGRKNATIISNGVADTSNFFPIFSQKSNTGSWDVGILADTFYFSWVSDSNYNAGTNDSKRISIDTSGNITANASSATKLANARTISLTGGATGSVSFDGSANVSISTNLKEAYLDWGGKNLGGAFSPIDAALSPELGANRLAFGSGDGITIEYSRDAGATWTEYTSVKADKAAILGTGKSFYVGKSSSTDKCTVDCQLRIILDTDKIPVYTIFKKFAIYGATNLTSGCWCTLDASLESTPTVFKTFVNKASISGSPGWNILNATISAYGNSAYKTVQYGLIRFTFGCDSVNSSVGSGFCISRIMGFGGVGWTTPSTLAKTGHIYSYDNSQNTTFPANVTAKTFVGNLSGTATKLARSGNTDNPMTFNWSGQTGQPSWLWGGNDGSNMYVYNPSNFNVASAKNVTQTAIDPTSYSNWRSLIWGAANNATEGFTPSTVTGLLYSANTLSVQPSTGTIKATTFKGNLSGNASTATKATKDSANQQINTTYIKGLSVSGKTITYTKGDGTTGTITTQDTNTTYSTGTASTSGLTKLYTGTGTATDGTMTQNAIKTALDGKLSLSGGTLTGAVKRSNCIGGVWIKGRENAAFISNGTNNTSSFYPLTSQKANNGSWETGVLGDDFYISWSSDTNYNSNTNSTNKISINPSGTINGVVTSAKRLETTRTVAANSGEFDMNFTYNGSANSTASLGYYSATGLVGNKANYPYHRIAKIDTLTSQYTDKTAIFLITQDYYGGGYGICRVTLRTNSSSQVSQASATWLVRSGFSASDLQIGFCNTAGATYADLFLRIPSAYGSIVVRCLSTGPRGSIARTWNLIDSKEVDNTTTTDALKSFEVYTSISAAATALHSKAYTSVLSATDNTIVAYSSKLGTVNVGNATQPIYLEAGTPKACTYTLGCSVPSGAKFTDTNTWRGIQNNLTSDSTTDSLSAAQGKALKTLVDGKAASSHTHNYAGASSAGGAATNALALNGFALASKTTVFGKVPYVGTDGVIELGRYIDLHYSDSEDKDYTTRITMVDGNGTLNIKPNASNTEVLRLTSNGQTSVLGFYGSIGVEGFLGFNNTNKLVRIDTTFKKEYRIHDTGSITYGTAAPTAAATAGDIYIQIT